MAFHSLLVLWGLLTRVVRFVHQYDEEYEAQKKARRPGRPASAREDLLKVTIASLVTEYQKGFCKAILALALRHSRLTCHPDLPDLSSEDNISMLARWEGSWSYLSNIKWVKITAAGDMRPSIFPPKA